MGIEMSAVVSEGASEVELVTVSGRAALRICAAAALDRRDRLAGLRGTVAGPRWFGCLARHPLHCGRDAGGTHCATVPWVDGSAARRGRRCTALRPLCGHSPHGRPALAVPWTKRRAISTRIHSHETTLIKVNDADGNPMIHVVIGRCTILPAPSTRSMTTCNSPPASVRLPCESSRRPIATMSTQTGGVTVRPFGGDHQAALEGDRPAAGACRHRGP